MSKIKLAASAEMLYLDLPFIERIKKIASKDLEVEIWGWNEPQDKLNDISKLNIPISSMTGYINGNLTDNEEIKKFLSSAEKSIEASNLINCNRLNIHGTGLDNKGLPINPVFIVTGKMWAKAALTLEKLAKLGEKYNKVFMLENLNLKLDHPGTPFATVKDTLSLIQAVDSKYLRLNLDLYHAQVDEGNLTELCEECMPWIGEIQIADVPGRCEPGTGEINYKFIYQALLKMGYEGVLALEGWAKNNSDIALKSFIETFS